MKNTNVASPATFAAVIAVIALTYGGIWKGGWFYLVTHYGLGFLGFLGLMYAAHAEPQPEMRRRQLIVVLGVVMLMLTLTD